MTWIKLDDNAVDHPKVESLSDRAFRWWVKGLSYASRFLTDGVLPPIFWKKVPTPSRIELTEQRLWDWADPNFLIHDYLNHQTRKEDVEADKERNRKKAADYRARKRDERSRVTGDALPMITGNVGGLVTNPDTENREQRTDTENRTTTPSSLRGPAIILSPKDYARLQETHAFVGSRLRIPNVLHLELLLKSGENADRDLRAWYLTLNDELELSGKGTGDVFAWLRPRHQAFAMSKGWIEPAPKAKIIPLRDDAELDAKLAAVERKR